MVVYLNLQIQTIHNTIVFKALFVLCQLTFLNLCYFWILSNRASAQVTPDASNINTQVNQNGGVAEITGGQTRGGNLFHSFQDFSVPTGNEAFFNNANDISNIFSRVTGGNISNIDGAIRNNGSASLFLINPAGIIFGNNARLDIGGSFLASTSSSILFEDGEFSAVDNLNEPVLTINAPIGLGFRDNPGDIVNRSFAQNSAGEFAGLEVTSGNSLTLAGGNINFEGGNLTASGGNINLGGLFQAGRINFNEDGSLSFPENVTRGNITLSNASEIDVRSSGGGNINVNARNLNLEEGESGVSRIRAGISPDSTLADAQAGDIVIDTTGNISLNEGRITNNQDGIGNSGNIFIATDSLSLQNGSDIGSNTLGQGNAGSVNITTTGNITADGESLEGIPSGITSIVNPGATGNSGGVTITTSNLNLTNGGVVDTSTLGQGDTGSVNITATENITADGESPGGFNSGIASLVNPGAEGSAGGVTISTSNLSLTNGGGVSSSILGQGNAGAVSITATEGITADGEDSASFPSGITSLVNPGAEGDAGGVTISTNNLSLTNGGRVDASTLGQGDAGSVNITATENITVDGENSGGFSSGIINVVNPGVEGDAGGITISVNNLDLTNGGQVSAGTFGRGNAGAINITATGDITANGENSDGIPSNITSQVTSEAEGDAGGIDISANSLSLTNGGQVSAGTFGRGNAGTINITATGNITADGENSGGFPSNITSQIGSGAEGDAGGIDISTNNLSLTNGGQVSAGTFGRGNAGAINVTATGDITADGEDSRGFASGIANGVNTEAEGNAGGVTISSGNLNLTNGGQVDSSTGGQGNAGNINVNTTESIAISGASENTRSGLFANTAIGNGNGGNVNVVTDQLTIGDRGTIEASNFDSFGVVPSGTGEPGNITIEANSIDLTDSARIEAASQSATGVGANVDLIVADNIALRNNSFISAQAFNNADGGNLNIDTNFIVAFPGDNDIVASAEQGQGG